VEPARRWAMASRSPSRAWRPWSVRSSCLSICSMLSLTARGCRRWIARQVEGAAARASGAGTWRRSRKRSTPRRGCSTSTAARPRRRRAGWSPGR
jgi:hypothetical protein